VERAGIRRRSGRDRRVREERGRGAMGYIGMAVAVTVLLLKRTYVLLCYQYLFFKCLYRSVLSTRGFNFELNVC
jgi:hypothetical protein